MYPPNPEVFFIPCQAAVRVRWNILAKHYEGLGWVGSAEQALRSAEQALVGRCAEQECRAGEQAPVGGAEQAPVGGAEQAPVGGAEQAPAGGGETTLSTGSPNDP